MTTLDQDTSDREHSDEERSRLRGLQEARAFDLRLRQLEGEDLKARLATPVQNPLSDPSAFDAAENAIRVVQLEARVSELNTYVRSVNESLPWRIIQRLRKLVGRSW